MPTTPRRWHALAVPKRGHRADEFEDAFAADAGRGRFAVADGVSESSFAGLWARQLVESFVREPVRPATWAGWLAAAQQRWRDEVNRLELPWYAEIKREEGAAATFLGVEVGAAGWRAVAVGDSCLLPVRAGRLRRPFPVTLAAAFDRGPDQLGSQDPIDPARPPGGWAKGNLRGGDRLLLATDAMAHWLLREKEAGRKPWADPAWPGYGPEPAFAAWVERERDQRRLRNDDVTLLVIEVGAGSSPAIFGSTGSPEGAA